MFFPTSRLAAEASAPLFSFQFPSLLCFLVVDCSFPSLVEECRAPAPRRPSGSTCSAFVCFFLESPFFFFCRVLFPVDPLMSRTLAVFCYFSSSSCGRFYLFFSFREDFLFLLPRPPFHPVRSKCPKGSFAEPLFRSSLIPSP